MAKRRESPTIQRPTNVDATLKAEVRHLADVIADFSSVMDHVRDEFQWMLRNGIPAMTQDAHPQHRLRDDEENQDEDDIDQESDVIHSPLLQMILGAVERSIDDAQHDRSDAVLDTLESLRNEIVAVIGENFVPRKDTSVVAPQVAPSLPSTASPKALPKRSLFSDS